MQVWRSAGGYWTLPYLVGGTWSQGVAINNLGQIVGTAGSSPTDFTGHAFLYSGGIMVDLNSVTVGLPSGVTLLGGMSINDVGQIFVWAEAGPGAGSFYYLLTPQDSGGPVPEPGSLALAGAGALIVLCRMSFARRRCY